MVRVLSSGIDEKPTCKLPTFSNEVGGLDWVKKVENNDRTRFYYLL